MVIPSNPSGSLSPSALARLLGAWNTGAAAAYRELADVVRLLVLDGRIALDVALPSERALAETLGVSRTTVTAAYAGLREQGFLSGNQGSRARTRLPHRVAVAQAPGLVAPDGVLDLAYASLPATGEVVHRAFAEALTELPALLPGFGYDPLGVPVLREAIAAHYTEAGVPTSASQILVTSGAQHALNNDYFDRIEALDYAIAHDDGQGGQDLTQADVILVGVSRTSKTPTCIYLAHRGVRAANVPLVPGRPPPQDLFELKNTLIVGLITSPDRLIQIRRNRLLSLKENRESDYVDSDAVRQEIIAARRLFERMNWPVIDITRRSVEETAAAIINLLSGGRGKVEVLG